MIQFPSPSFRARFCCVVFAAIGLATRLAAADRPVVADGKATATIVTPDRPTAVVSYAAEELASHLEKATGARLGIVPESAFDPASGAAFFLGPTRAAATAGIDTATLPPETFVMRTRGAALLIGGNDGGGDPLDADTRAGTLWGVYEWLDRMLKVRWVWPGELGTFVPKTSTVALANFDETISPRFFQRRIRQGSGFTSEHPALGFTAAAFAQFSHEQAVFLRRHRMGRSYPAGYGHAFTDWWKTYGAAHPEWFQLRDGGKRGPSKPSARFSMCVSNSEFQQQVVANWDAKRGRGSAVPSFVNACENDILGLCACDACRAWDGPAPQDYLTYYSATSKMAGSRFVSDRYARFWLSIQQLAAQRDPEATVIGYVYFNYFQAPTSGIRLNPHILLGFCPSGGFFPRSAEEHDWMKRQWIGWRDTGARLFLRTNHLLDGYCMPFIFAHQFADEFQNAVRNGMVATDLDSLTGHWATQGPNLYTAARLHVCPEASVETILGEYFAAFGPAAAKVQSYFDYWERYTTEHRQELAQAMETLQASRWRTWAKAAHAVYPPECFAPAEAMLAAAKAAAGSEPAAVARVEFLETGLLHAKLCARVAARLTLANPGASADETKRLLDELIAMRRATERTGIGNFNHLAWVEDLSWKLSDEVRKQPDLYP